MIGQHVFAKVYDCAKDRLDDCDGLVKLLETAAVIAGATVIKSMSHKFDPQGVTALVLLSESHVSIHTYPEHGIAVLDMFTCGSCDPMSGALHIIKSLDCNKYTIDCIDR